MPGKFVLITTLLAAAVIVPIFAGTSSVQAGSVDDTQKSKVRDPHLVHFEIGKDVPPIGFTVGEIKDWPNFVKTLQSRLFDLPFSEEMQFLIDSLMPHLTSVEEQKVIVSEINQFLVNPGFYSQMKAKTTFSDTTENLRKTYLSTKTQEDLKWLNRSIINDLIPQAPRVAVAEGKKFEKLRNINCLTCHEAWDRNQPGNKSDVNQIGAVPTDLQKLTEMISAQLIHSRPSPPPKPDKIRADDEFMRNYDNLKKFIVRPKLYGNPVLIEAVHPGNPYTFKPLLKRLVCLDCHALDRGVDKIQHADGKTHRVKFFYGPVEETHDQQHSQ